MAAHAIRVAVDRDWDGLLHDVAVGTIAGGIAGMLVGGIGSRIAMRIAGAMTDPALVGIARTDNGNVLGEITVGGTLALVFFGGLFPGVLGGLVYVAARPWLRPLGPWAGVAFGLMLLAALGATVIEPFNIDFRAFGVPLVNVALFALLFPLFGLAMQWSERVVERRIEDARGSSRALILWTSAGLAAFFLVPLVVGVLVGDRVDLRPLIPVYLFAAALALRALPRAVGYVALALPALIGAPATISAILQIAR